MTYDLSLHSNPDASKWTDAFLETWKTVSPEQPVPDRGWMLGWFANAMMAMHDHCVKQNQLEVDALRTQIKGAINVLSSG